MRNMSFALTTEQVRNQTKTVTRRLGWHVLKPGDIIQPIVKGMGLKKGQSPEKIGGPIRVVSVTRVRLGDMTQAECSLEGFPWMLPESFVEMFIQCNGRPASGSVTRIEFAYTEPKE